MPPGIALYAVLQNWSCEDSSMAPARIDAAACSSDSTGSGPWILLLAAPLLLAQECKVAHLYTGSQGRAFAIATGKSGTVSC